MEEALGFAQFYDCKSCGKFGPVRAILAPDGWLRQEISDVVVFPILCLREERAPTVARGVRGIDDTKIKFIF